VASPSVKLLFDIYHVQIMEGYLIPNIRNQFNGSAFSHRRRAGRINRARARSLSQRLQAIYDLGFEGFAALEYGRRFRCSKLGEYAADTMFE